MEAPVNPNKALWEKGKDATAIPATFLRVTVTP